MHMPPHHTPITLEDPDTFWALIHQAKASCAHDMEAMEALAWRMHQRMRKRYRNRVDARRKKQEALLNTLRACFGLKPV